MVAHASVLSFTVLNFIAVYIQTHSYIYYYGSLTYISNIKLALRLPRFPLNLSWFLMLNSRMALSYAAGLPCNV